MTVAELIVALQALPATAVVAVQDTDWGEACLPEISSTKEEESGITFVLIEPGEPL